MTPVGLLSKAFPVRKFFTGSTLSERIITPPQQPVEACVHCGSSIRLHGWLEMGDDGMGRLNANVALKFDWVSGLPSGACLSAPRKILEFLKMNAKYKMSLLPKRCWGDSTSRMSSLLLYNYLLPFTDSDSCESLKKIQEYYRYAVA